jgi:hypothetical protein
MSYPARILLNCPAAAPNLALLIDRLGALMKNALHAAVAVLAFILLGFGAVRGIGWAKKGGVPSRLTASALMLGVAWFMPVVKIKPPDQGVEQAEENRDKTDDESGAPPFG